MTCKQCGVKVVCLCWVRLCCTVRLSEETVLRVCGNGIAGEAWMTNCVDCAKYWRGLENLQDWMHEKNVIGRSFLQSAQVGARKWISIDHIAEGDAILSIPSSAGGDDWALCCMSRMKVARFSQRDNRKWQRYMFIRAKKNGHTCWPQQRCDPEG